MKVNLSCAHCNGFLGEYNDNNKITLYYTDLKYIEIENPDYLEVECPFCGYQQFFEKPEPKFSLRSQR